jgi:hypothetical protein
MTTAMKHSPTKKDASGVSFRPTSIGAPLWPADKVERWPTDKLVLNARNARTHSDAQVDQIAASIHEWGWTSPVLVTEQGMIIAGHGWQDAMKRHEMSALLRRDAGLRLGSDRYAFDGATPIFFLPVRDARGPQ